MKKLLKNICGSYTSYFNKKYQRVGPLFQDRFKAVLIDNDSYLQHISRYIHLNPRAYLEWEFSSLPYYLGKKRADWVKPKATLELFESVDDYRQFVADYESYKRDLDILKSELAN